jgi:hypothetical protein
MKETLIIIGAALAGLSVFGFIAKKYGSNCLP